jgi:hypothetical protein
LDLFLAVERKKEGKWGLKGKGRGKCGENPKFSCVAPETFTQNHILIRSGGNINNVNID